MTSSMPSVPSWWWVAGVWVSIIFFFLENTTFLDLTTFFYIHFSNFSTDSWGRWCGSWSTVRGVPVSWFSIKGCSNNLLRLLYGSDGNRVFMWLAALKEREAHMSAQSCLSSSSCTGGHGIGASLSDLRGHRCMEREVLRATSWDLLSLSPHSGCMYCCWTCWEQVADTWPPGFPRPFPPGMLGDPGRS